MSHPGYESIEPTVPPQAAIPRFLYHLAQLVAGLMQGRANTVIDLTLTANAASTTLTDARLHYYQGALFDPMTANAAAELAAGTIYVTQANRLNGAWTITHANNAQTDRTYRVIISG